MYVHGTLQYCETVGYIRKVGSRVLSPPPLARLSEYSNTAPEL
jgi:hypothetical protein